MPDRMPKLISRVWNSVRNILVHIINNNGNLIESENLKFIVKLKERLVTEYEVASGALIRGPIGYNRMEITVRYDYAIMKYWLLIMDCVLINNCAMLILFNSEFVALK